MRGCALVYLTDQLTDYSGLEVHKHGTGHVLASSSLAEEGVERVVTTADGLVRGHLAIRLDAVLQAVEFPAGIADLDSGLADVDGDTLTLKGEEGYIKNIIKPTVKTAWKRFFIGVAAVISR